MDSLPRKTLDLNKMMIYQKSPTERFLNKNYGEWFLKDIQTGLWVIAESIYRVSDVISTSGDVISCKQSTFYLANRIFARFTWYYAYPFCKTMFYAHACLFMAIRLDHHVECDATRFIKDYNFEYTKRDFDLAQIKVMHCIENNIGFIMVTVSDFIDFYIGIEQWSPCEVTVIHYMTRLMTWTLGFMDFKPSLLVACSFYYTCELFGRDAHCLVYMNLRPEEIATCKAIEKKLMAILLLHQNNKFKSFNLCNESDPIEKISNLIGVLKLK